MSIFGSAKTNFNVSEMSLGSSALITAASTFSDCDYDTASEIHSSPNQSNDNFQLSRCSSNVRYATNCNYFIGTQSSSVTINRNKDSLFSLQANKYVLTIKSDTCLRQKNEDISNFMNDILRVQQRHIKESNAIITAVKSLNSIQNERFPVRNLSKISSIHKIDVNSYKSAESINRNSSCNESKISTPEKLESISDIQKNSSDIIKKASPTVSQTKLKILENLTHVTCNKLFSKSGLNYSDCDNPSIETTFINKNQDKAESKVSTPSQIPQFSRRFFRNRGVKSILQIDHELQPLNIKLSRLLAKFRAMNLRGKLGYINTNIYDFSFSSDLDKSYFLPKDTSFKSESRRTMKNFVVTDQPMTINKGSQKNITLKTEKDTCTPFLQSKEGTKASSVSHERLDVNRTVAKAKNYAQSSRSCESDRRVSRDTLKGCTQLRVKTMYKRNSRMRCCKQHKKSMSHFCHYRKQQSHRESRCITSDRLPRKEKTDDDEDFGRKKLDEIASMISPCYEEERHRRDFVDIDDEKKITNSDTKAKVLKKSENESSKLHYFINEETEENSFSCRGLISSSENCAFIMQPSTSPGLSSTDDLLSNDNHVNDRVKPFEETCDLQGDC